MILKASERSGALRLGRHLLNFEENDHVEVHELRGFVADDLIGALAETQAVAAGTRCKNFLFSVSLSPPANERAPVEAFENAIAGIEERLGLEAHPRATVFHEKDGRRHAHCVWSRIDASEMRAINLSHYKLKLRDLSRDLYLEHGWRMPRGLMNSAERDPRTFGLAEWQQAKRAGRDPRETKAAIQDCWAVSDTQTAFERALESRGLYLARGDRRGFVALTFEGEAVSVARAVGRPAKTVKARVGDPEALRSVEETKGHIASIIAPKLRDFLAEADKRRTKAMGPLLEARSSMKAAHGSERQKLDDGMERRRVDEARQRAERLRGGVRGLWDRVTGERARAIRQNAAEALASLTRDRGQRADLVTAQLGERLALQERIMEVRHRHARTATGLHRELHAQERQRPGSGLAAEFGKAPDGHQAARTMETRPKVERPGPSLEM